MPKQLHAAVHGRVQGVFFRAWTKKQGTSLSLSGWVRNRQDGSVEIFATGGQEELFELERRLHQGPPGARVDRVDASYQEAGADTGKGFQIRYA
ncbi:MAG: acylphosphatase [Desulfovibrionales bacterium]